MPPLPDHVVPVTSTAGSPGAARVWQRVGRNVEFIDAFLEHGELIDYLQAADVYATPYSNPAQITSGTLSYAVGVGNRITARLQSGYLNSYALIMLLGLVAAATWAMNR